MDAFDLRQWEGFGPAGGTLSEPAIVDQITIDSRRIDSGNALFVALKGEREDGHDFVKLAQEAGAKFALVSKDWQPSSPLLKLTLLRTDSPLKALQSIAKAYRLKLCAKIIGITGSFGKTMVKDLLYSLLETQRCAAASPESFNSQIGVALSLLNVHMKNDIAVIEAAISEPGEMDALVEMIQPDFTLLTPIGKKHLATMPGISGVLGETMKLLLSTPKNGWALIPSCKDLKIDPASLPCQAFYWDIPQPGLPHATTIPFAPLSSYQISFPDSVKYEGQMNAGHAYFLNLLNMASKAAWLAGISSANILSVLQNYQIEPMRTEIWKSPLGPTFVNDIYCSDPQSVDHALKHFDYATAGAQKFFVFGGMRGKSPSSQMEYRRIGKSLSKEHLSHLLLVGQKPYMPLIEEVQRNAGETQILAFDNYEETLSYLQLHIKNQDLVVFKGENKLPLDKLNEAFNDSLPNNQCIINLAAIQSNLSLIRKKLPQGSRIMVMVKALAYGTDDVRVSKFLSRCGIDILGVSYVDEGVALKRAGIRQSIFSINAAPYEVGKVVKWDLEVGVSDSALIQGLAMEAERSKKIVKVHLHINTGMGRFGCRIEDACKLAHLIQSFPTLELQGAMTHFACAEDPHEDPFTLRQIEQFDKAIDEIEKSGISLKWKHAANSSAALRFHLPQYNMVRLGLAVYGLYGSDAVRKCLELSLAISLTSRIVAINHCEKGDSISYGRKYRISRAEQRIAVLPIGYFDGLHRHYSGKAHVLIHGQKAPMVGNICMDNMMIDITDIPDAAVGDSVLIFGEDGYGYYLSPEDFALSGNSIVHELMTCLGPRIPRIFVYEESKQIR